MATPISDGPSSSHHYQSCYPLQPRNCGFTALFIICLLHYNGSSIRTGNLAALRRPQHVEQHLAHSRRSINICGMKRVRRGHLSQCAEGLDGPGSCKPLPGPGPGEKAPAVTAQGPGRRGVGHGRELGCPGRWQEAASLSASSTSDFSSTSTDTTAGNFKSAPGSFQPQARSSSERLPCSHSHQSSLDLLPPASQHLQRLFPWSAVLCPPLLSQ